MGRPGRPRSIFFNVGERVAELTIVKEIKPGVFRCSCSCGKTKTLPTSSLSRTRSCGHLRGRRRTTVFKSGDKLGGLTVLRETGMAMVNGKKRVFYECLCHCGKTAIRDAYTLKYGKSKSCGCIVVKHGLTSKYTDKETRKAYFAWRDIIQRCSNPEHPFYKDYGGRGITVCERWSASPRAFIEDVGLPPVGLTTIDRINNELSYEPGNVRWTTNRQSMRNRRNTRRFSYSGQNLTVDEWSERTGIPARVIYSRIHLLKWPVDRAVTTPVRKRSTPSE